MAAIIASGCRHPRADGRPSASDGSQPPRVGPTAKCDGKLGFKPEVLSLARKQEADSPADWCAILGKRRRGAALDSRSLRQDTETRAFAARFAFLPTSLPIEAGRSDEWCARRREHRHL